MLQDVLGLLFPRVCLGCRTRGWPWCSTCRQEVAVLLPPGCRRCGRPLADRVPRCGDCPPFPIGWCRAAFLYEGPVRRALFQLKFAGMRSVAEALAPFMVDAMARSPPRPSAGEQMAVTWVPLGVRRKRARGYDQAEALARKVGRLTGLAGGGPARAHGGDEPPGAEGGGMSGAAPWPGRFARGLVPPGTSWWSTTC